MSSQLRVTPPGGRGVAVPNTVEPDRDGNLSFFIKDGEGRQIEFCGVNYEM